METTVRHETFASGPVGRVLVDSRWMVWCDRPGVAGTAAFGSLNRDEARRWLRALEVLPSIPGQRAELVDLSLVEHVDPSAFDLLQERIASRDRPLDVGVRRRALLQQAGLSGALALLFQPGPVQGVTVRAFEDRAQALAWLLGHPEPALAHALDDLAREAIGMEPVVLELRAALREFGLQAEIDDVAKCLGTSERTLQRRLKDAGTNFRALVAQLRIERAQELLRATDEPLTSIAYELGFSSPQNFSTAFRQIVGTSPSAWREDAQQRAASDPIPEPTPAPAPQSALPGFPVERDGFFGRADAFEALAQALQSARLVTLVGPGGAGKTRLATRHAHQTASRWPRPPLFVDLAEARSDAAILAGLARALEVRTTPDAALGTLGAALRARGKVLLVLDNLEQVIDPARVVLRSLLDAAPQTHILATSREALRLPEEATVDLGPLDTPAAVDLFVDRARRADPAFDPTTAAPVLEELVRLLDGLPLALELAASRVRVLGVERIAERMGERFRLLAEREGRRPARHLTLRAALDWSWELLDPPEQAALAQLGVFEGGFTLEAAEAVLDVGAFDPEPWPLDLVQTLVERSLVQRVSDSRFQLLQSVQAYALEKLAATGRREALDVRHGAWAGWGVMTPAQEAPNLEAAVRRALRRGDGATALDAFARLWGVVDARGPYDLVLPLALALPGLPDLDAHGRGRALRLAGTVAHAVRNDAARSLLEEALFQARQAGDPAERARTARALGRLHGEASEPLLARDCLLEAKDAAREAHDDESLALTLGNLGNLDTDLGDLASARQHFTEAQALFRTRGDAGGAAWVTSGLAALAADEARFEEARALYTDVLDFQRSTANRRSQAFTHNSLSYIAIETGDLKAALEHGAAAAALHEEVGNRAGQGSALCHLGEAEWLAGDAARATRLLADAARMARDNDHRRHEVLATEIQAVIALDQGQVSQARALVDRALVLASEGGLLPLVALCCCTQAHVALAQEDAALARQALDEADEHLGKRTKSPVRVLCRATRALVAQADGRGQAPSFDDEIAALGMKTTSSLARRIEVARKALALRTR